MILHNILPTQPRTESGARLCKHTDSRPRPRSESHNSSPESTTALHPFSIHIVPHITQHFFTLHIPRLSLPWTHTNLRRAHTTVRTSAYPHAYPANDMHMNGLLYCGSSVAQKWK